MRCTITIEETDGELQIYGDIPTAAEKTIAGALAEKLLEGARVMMNDAMGENQKFHIGKSN